MPIRIKYFDGGAPSNEAYMTPRTYGPHPYRLALRFRQQSDL
jgi:hypothetical protein